ncbi:hypothetical protein FACS1894218_4430 [Bacilli bacterium]|nr:hypothetical protein FACS1894218_4430 [Bacilli bacterium]
MFRAELSDRDLTSLRKEAALGNESSDIKFKRLSMITSLKAMVSVNVQLTVIDPVKLRECGLTVMLTVVSFAA